jgi:hypothetical protein
MVEQPLLPLPFTSDRLLPTSSRILFNPSPASSGVDKAPALTIEQEAAQAQLTLIQMAQRDLEAEQAIENVH